MYNETEFKLNADKEYCRKLAKLKHTIEIPKHIEQLTQEEYENLKKKYQKNGTDN